MRGNAGIGMRRDRRPGARTARGRPRWAWPVSLKREIARRIDPGVLQKLAHRRHVILRQAVMRFMEAMGMAIQLHRHLAMSTMPNLGAQALQDGLDDLRIDIAADRMREQGVQGGAMLMIHGLGTHFR